MTLVLTSLFFIANLTWPNLTCQRASPNPAGPPAGLGDEPQGPAGLGMPLAC